MATCNATCDQPGMYAMNQLDQLGLTAATLERMREKASRSPFALGPEPASAVPTLADIASRALAIADTARRATDHPQLDSPMHELLQVAVNACSVAADALKPPKGDESDGDSR